MPVQRQLCHQPRDRAENVADRVARAVRQAIRRGVSVRHPSGASLVRGSFWRGVRKIDRRTTKGNASGFLASPFIQRLK
jgi:hypothetical protein